MESQNSKKLIECIEKLLNNEKFDIYESGLSTFFEYACCTLFDPVRPGYWYDGVTGIEVQKRKKKQLEFIGKMWVAQGQSKQWLESFHAIVTDKRITKQGIWLSANIGEFHAEGNFCDHI